MLRPFSRYCIMIGAIPESIIHSLSYEQQLLRLIKFLKQTVIPAIDGNTTAIKKIEEWIEHVDLQEFVDTKLDEMAESGELEEIISVYLNSTAVFGFDKVSDMTSASNLIDGSYARTCGKTTFNDGFGALYKIREIENTDVVDGDKIVAMDDVDLVAEKIKSKTKPKKIIMIGDSYGDELNEWPTKFATFMKQYNNAYTDSDFYNWCVSGASAIERTGTDYPTYLEELQNNASVISDKEEVGSIILCAGYNDQIFTENNIFAALVTLKAYIDTTYPNAKFYLGMIGWSNDPSDSGAIARLTLIQQVLPAYQKMVNYGAIYLTNVECCSHLYGSNYWKTDNIHPSELLSTIQARGIMGAYISGSANITINVQETINGVQLQKQIHNGITEFNTAGLNFNFSSSPKTLEIGDRNIDCGEYTCNVLRTLRSWGRVPCNIMLQNNADSTWETYNGELYYHDGHIYVYFRCPKSSYVIKQIYIDTRATKPTIYT